jgi:hypothetical protein
MNEVRKRSLLKVEQMHNRVGLKRHFCDKRDCLNIVEKVPESPSKCPWENWLEMEGQEQ